MAATKDALNAYIKEADLEKRLEDAVSATIRARPLDPVGFLAKTLAAKAKPLDPVFYSVEHTFVDDQKKVDGWLEFVGAQKPEDQKANSDKWHAMGFHNHAFLPASMSAGGKVNCLWECKVDCSPEVFQSFVDGPDGPGEGVFVNKCFKMMPGGLVPESFFANKEVEHPKNSPAGDVFWVRHDFVSADAGGKFWSFMQSLKPSDMAGLTAKWNGIGYHNHTFFPGAPEGPCYCIWEADKTMSVEDFAAFIDGPDGPGQGVPGVDGSVFKNTCHKVLPGASLLDAKFTLKAQVCRQFGTGFKSGESIKACTPTATFNPPGAPPMGMEMFMGMFGVTLKAFPEWESKVAFVEEQADGTCIVGTQQISGPMKEDMAAMGPFPEVTLAAVPEQIKTGVVFPVEVGRYSFNAAGDKIQSGTYFGYTREGVGEPVTPLVAEKWNKKGDLSDVGFGMLYELMLGSPLPAPPPATPPESVALFFNGEPMASKKDAVMAGMADYATIGFVGPFAYPIPLMDKEKLGGAMGNLVASFPDLTFNVKKVTPQLTATGGWAADIVVGGHFTGAPFSPMPGKLPAVEPTGAFVSVGPETFTLHADAEGKVYKTEIRPGHAGAPHGPPGFYKLVGGKLPF